MKNLIILLVVVFFLSFSSAAENLNCAVCQLLATSTSKNRTELLKPETFAHCQRFDGCSQKLEECEIVKIVLNGVTSSSSGAKGTKFEKSKPFLESAVEQCASNPKALVISEAPSKTTCMICVLVYDVLKYINYNILDSPMIGDITTAIYFACNFINQDLCDAIGEAHAIDAIVRGLKDSLGSFYDLIAVQGFQCPPYTNLFGQC